MVDLVRKAVAPYRSIPGAAANTVPSASAGKWFATLACRLALAFVFLSLIGLFNALVMGRMIGDLSGVAETINVSGRLRMLSQKAYVDAVTHDFGRAENYRRLRSTIAEFEAGLLSLEHGGLLRDGNLKRLPGVSESRLVVIQDRWRNYREQLLRLVQVEGVQAFAAERAAALIASKQMLADLESLVRSSLVVVQEREVAARHAQYAIFIIDLIALLLVFCYVRLRMVRPLRDLARTSEAFGNGRYAVRSQHVGDDEIGQLASSFNLMAEKLMESFQKISASAMCDRESLLNARRLSQVIEHSPLGVLITDRNGLIEYANPRFSEISGYTCDEIIGQSTRIFQSGKTSSAVYRNLWQTIRSGQSWCGSLLNRKKDGGLIWEQIRISPLFDDDENLCHYVVVREDVTVQRVAERMQRLQQRAVEACGAGLAMISVEADFHRIIYVNPAYTRITGFEQDDLVDAPAASLFGFNPDDGLYEETLKALGNDSVRIWISRTTSKSGRNFWCEYALTSVSDEDRKITHYVVTVSDVTERIDYEQRLCHQANHDSLTGLANRLLFADRATQAISHAKRYGQCVAIVLVDLDHFKYVNDSLGHAVGDQLLKIAAERLRESVRGIDTVARMGGDEFVLILTELACPDEAEAALQRVTTSIAAPYLLDCHESHISCSVGVSFFPRDGGDAEELLKKADTAMYQAKAVGRNTYRYYEPEMNERLAHRLSIETQLRHALERDEFFLEFQPQVDLARKEIYGVEALIRWRHPELGLVPPHKFIPLAEEIGLIVPIGQWVLERACMQAQVWNSDGCPPLRIAVNLSVHQLRHRSLLGALDRAFRLSGLPPHCLEVEITESVVVDDAESVIRLLRMIKERGVSIALDDFGTGYSSLAYLKRLPIDVLKIDQSFVRGIDVDSHDAALTRTVIALAESLDLRTVAEGVEVETQARLLAEWGCESAQGYFFHRPLGADEISRILAAQQVSPVSPWNDASRGIG